MPQPPRRRRGSPGGDGPSSEIIAADHCDRSDHTLNIPISQLHRPIGPGELAALRAVWWRQASAGHRLPAEIDIVVIEGGEI